MPDVESGVAPVVFLAPDTAPHSGLSVEVPPLSEVALGAIVGRILDRDAGDKA